MSLESVPAASVTLLFLYQLLFFRLQAEFIMQAKFVLFENNLKPLLTNMSERDITVDLTYYLLVPFKLLEKNL